MKISSSARAAIVRHAVAAQPRECCGILLGSDDLIVDAVPAANIAAEPGRFLVDPKDHIDARRAARSRRLEVVGFYHSHPHSAPVPSATDLAQAAYPDLIHLIVGLQDVPAALRLFRIVDGNFEEMRLVTVG